MGTKDELAGDQLAGQFIVYQSILIIYTQGQHRQGFTFSIDKTRPRPFTRHSFWPPDEPEQ